MGKSKTYSGFTDKTKESLLLDAGAFYLNFVVGTDTPETAKSKLLGATRNGGEFGAMPSIRSIDIDGVKGKAKGLQVIDSWDVFMKANVLEISKESLAKGLTATNAIDSDTIEGYDIITAKNYIEIGDYIDNVTYVGKISGKEKPVIIQIYNALNIEGLKLQVKDKDEAVVALNFVGCYDPSTLDTPPFKIFYPKE